MIVFGIPSESDGVKMAPKIDQAVQNLRNFLFPGTVLFRSWNNLAPNTLPEAPMVTFVHGLDEFWTLFLTFC